jgi:hypothetical protein
MRLLVQVGLTLLLTAPAFRLQDQNMKVEMDDPQEIAANLPSEKLPNVATEDVLRVLGFEVDSNVLSDGMPGLSFDFGNFKLEASENVNLWFQSVIVLGGVMATDRTTAVVHFEMPLELESFEQGMALVTHCLDSHACGNFKGSSPVEWLNEGRRHRHLLPWYKQSSL